MLARNIRLEDKDSQHKKKKRKINKRNGCVTNNGEKYLPKERRVRLLKEEIRVEGFHKRWKLCIEEYFYIKHNI